MSESYDTWFPTFRRMTGIDPPFPAFWRWRTTRGQQQSLLRLIAVAMEQNLPLAPLIEAWAADESGVQRNRLRRLARLLCEGMSLPGAVEEVKGVLNDEQKLAIRFGTQSGTLTASIHDALDEPSATNVWQYPRLKKSLIYCAILVVIATLIVTFIAIKIVPQFRAIIREFDLSEPPFMVLARQMAEIFAEYWFVWVLALIAVGWLLSSRWPGRQLRYAILDKLFRPLRQLRTASVLRKLSVASQAGRPISGAISTLARYHFDSTYRHRLLFVRNEIEQGADVWQSMANTGLLNPADVQVLELSEKVGNRPWALKQLALAKSRATMRRLSKWSEFAMPALVFVLGAFVLIQALGVFSFLANVVKSLA
jgi:type II secretory pathway component PulF